MGLLHSSRPETDADSAESTTEDNPHSQSVDNEASNSDTLPGAHPPGQTSENLRLSGGHGGLSAVAAGGAASNGARLSRETEVLGRKSAERRVVSTLCVVQPGGPGVTGPPLLPLEAPASAASHQPPPEGE